MNTKYRHIHTIDGTLFFDPQDPIFLSHFPKNPVVPGSLLIHTFVALVRTHGRAHNKVVLRNFKFKHFVKPGSYKYQLEFSSGSIQCRLFDRSHELVSGVIHDT